MPYATIVVPAFNAALTLADTLASLQAQTFRDLEIVVVDDGSTDETAQIAADHARADRRLRLVQQNNRGLAGARNSGIAHASGAVIGFCDADDRWLPQKMAVHVDHLEAMADVGLSYSGSALIDTAGNRLWHAQRPRLFDVSSAHVFKRNPVGNGSSAVLRRAALEDIAWRPRFDCRRNWVFDETFRQSEDIECWLRLCLATDWSVQGVPGLLTEYRVSAGGLSARTEAQLASWERMVAKLRPLNPGFFDRHEPAARAYQLRYLARRACSSGDGDKARDYAARAFATSRRPLIEEPMRSLTTWAAAQALSRLGETPRRFARAALSTSKVKS
ncbi:glycosyltransferase family 2 protein [Tropicibacter oceani]|uniref:Glycosyltransferase family 2 protein n=1 Tax=Tropicibacter oceani TaxID=3058420 RepID=A0ABY8QCQ5_9RHOB|nr:glycosyltransferase family 2 protein [Tropicibacter oceani]WGW02404.1 glycosyltransferase family 2 protein [Tropicibacter oceani]